MQAPPLQEPFLRPNKRLIVCCDGTHLPLKPACLVIFMLLMN